MRETFRQVTELPENILRTAELMDFDLNKPLGRHVNGQFGTVHIVPTNWAVLKSRINLQANHHPYWNTVTINMLYNFRAPNSQITHYQKSMFDQEYSFPCTFPSWTIVNVFNYFRADLVPALLPDNAQVNIFSERTTYFTMEAGAGSLESF